MFQFLFFSLVGHPRSLFPHKILGSLVAASHLQSPQNRMICKSGLIKQNLNCSSLTLKCFSFDEVQVCLEETKLSDPPFLFWNMRGSWSGFNPCKFSTEDEPCSTPVQIRIGLFLLGLQVFRYSKNSRYSRYNRNSWCSKYSRYS